MLLFHKLKGIQLLDPILHGSYFIALLLQIEHIGRSACITPPFQQEYIGTTDGWMVGS
jgi:hypothetical protein